MNQEIKATVLYFIIALICFCTASYGAYIVNETIGTYIFSLTFIIIPLATLYFITKSIFPKKIDNV